MIYETRPTSPQVDALGWTLVWTYSTCLRGRRIPALDRLTVTEAATLLGVTRDAIYKRVQRGQIPWDKDNEGRVYVYVDPAEAVEDKSTDANGRSTDTDGKSADSSTSTTQAAERDALLEALREQNEMLRTEVEDWKEEARRKDHIIMTMAQRIPELEPAEPREPAVSTSEERGSSETTQDQEQPSWWRRIFGS